MIELRDWIQSTRFAPKPWLMLGKGPSFARRGEFPLADYNLMGLNHVVGELPVQIAHIIDADVAEACADRLAANCEWLIMPRHPHVDSDPGERLLEDFFDDIPVLRELDSQGKLVWYNAATSRQPIADSPVIGVRFFSSEAAMNILAEMGVKQVRSLGIDGGDSYSEDFKDLEALQNRRPSFDAQFPQIEETVRRYGIDYDPLIEPMRVFIGLDEADIVAARVLEYTIRKHASRPVRVVPMLDLPTPVPKEHENRQRTGFSFSRFWIPKLSRYKGRALYVDSDMQVFSDIAELWEIPFGDRKVLCTRQDEPPEQWRDTSWFHPGRQMSVMMLDCERLEWDIDEIVRGLDDRTYTYQQLMFDLCVVEPEEIGDDLPPQWNHLEQYKPGETKLVHYTVVPTQPWRNDTNPLRDVWMSDYREAEAAGVVTKDDVERLALAGHIKPTLAWLPPGAEKASRFDYLVWRLRRLLSRAEQRFGALRRPAVLRLRLRLGRMVETLQRGGRTHPQPGD